MAVSKTIDEQLYKDVKDPESKVCVASSCKYNSFFCFNVIVPDLTQCFVWGYFCSLVTSSLDVIFSYVPLNIN